MTYLQLEDYIKKCELLQSSQKLLSKSDYLRIQKNLSKELDRLLESEPKESKSTIK